MKRELERVATETGRSEAELIREGISLALDHHKTVPPRSGIFASGESSLAEQTDELLSGFGRR
jgi:hypothetical protein